MDLLPKRKQGRPTLAESAARKALIESMVLGASKPAPVAKTDEKILSDIKDSFEIMAIMVDGAVAGKIRALIISGASGIGKSYTIESKLRDAKTFGNTNSMIISGGISAIGLYKLGYKYRHQNSVLVLDDSDGIFDSIEAFSVLKAMCDSSTNRVVHWLKESNALTKGDEEVPTSYNFDASMIFVTNIDIQGEIDRGANKYAVQYAAVASRSAYIDLMIHDYNQIGVWVNHIASTSGMFVDKGIEKEEEQRIMTFMNVNRADLRNISLRTIGTACDIMSAAPDEFERIASKVLLRVPE